MAGLAKVWQENDTQFFVHTSTSVNTEHRTHDMTTKNRAIIRNIFANIRVLRGSCTDGKIQVQKLLWILSVLLYFFPQM